MSRGKTLLYILISALFAVSTGHPVAAQTDSLVLSGDALRKAYRFEESLDVYEQALEETAGAFTSRHIFRVLIYGRSAPEILAVFFLHCRCMVALFVSV